MANEFVARNGVIALRDSVISGSLFLHNNLYAPNNITDFYISASGDDGLGTAGANININAGHANSGGSIGTGGALSLSAGSGYTAFGPGQGGEINIFSGGGNGTNSVGGNINLVAGTGDPLGTGADGNIIMNAHSGYVEISAPTVDLNTGGDLIWSANPLNYINLAGTGDSNISAYGPLNISLFDGVGFSGYNYKAIFRSSSLDLLTPLNVSGSASITGSLNVTQNITASNALFSGTITAQTIYAQVITSSTEYVTGSTIFGSLLTNTHQFTGSVSITGSLSVAGLINGTSSFATSASFAGTSVTSSYPITVSGSTLYSTYLSTSNFNTTNSIFLGLNAGNGATLAFSSNFFGSGSGNGALSANFSNFLGWNAGSGATNAFQSNFLGQQAGLNGTNTQYSNFLGGRAGYGATNASYSNFLGSSAGENATSAQHSNFLGNASGYGASSATYSNFFGYNAGLNAINANNSVFIGQNTGRGATNADNSTFIGQQAGREATNANNSTFIGNQAGYQATGANNSQHIGVTAGFGTLGADYSTFIGASSGFSASFARFSQFIGQASGYQAYSASFSQFIGAGAGNAAYFASNSIYIGYIAGTSAYYAGNSNFIGYYAGAYALNASYSTLIGWRAGYNTSGLSAGSIGSNNIVIGTNISVTPLSTDKINIGGLIFGSGSYSTTTGNPFSGSANGKIGINQPIPSYNLDVSGSGNFTNGLTITGSVIATNFTGSLLGTASYASNALTASYALNSAGGGGSAFPYTGSAIVTGSIVLTGSFEMVTGSFIISSSQIPITYNPFADDYNRGTLSPGGTPSLTYTNTNTGTGNTTIVSNYLNIANGAVAGKSYTTVPLSGFNTPYNTTLSSNAAPIEWTVNARTNRSSAVFSGFGTNQYGGAFVLVGSNTNIQTAGQGYAVVYGGDTFRNWRLVRYNNGLSGTLTNVVTAGTNIFSANTNYVSIRVTYAPSTNTWALYVRDDGASAWSNPATGVVNLIGSAVDSIYTGTAMSVLGFLYSYATTANQNMQFDNLTIASSAPSGPGTVLDIKQDASLTINQRVFHVSANQNVGIGDTVFDSVNPERLLVSGSSVSSNIIVGKSSINNFTQLNITNKSNGSNASADVVATNDTGTDIGNFIDMGINSSTFAGTIGAANEAYLYNTGSNLWIGNATPGANGNIKFFAGNLATAATLIISSSYQTTLSGSLAVGNITPSATNGRIDASNDIVAFSTSDERLKTNITPIQDALTKVTQIGGYEFDWMLNPEIHGNKGHDVGVIAQEIEKILPEVVTTRDNGYKAVKYEKIVPLLIEAIKDLQQQINELKNK
jgi:hypothetical protein